MFKMDWSTKSWWRLSFGIVYGILFRDSERHFDNEEHWRNWKHASWINLLDSKISHQCTQKIGWVRGQKFMNKKTDNLYSILMKEQFKIYIITLVINKLLWQRAQAWLLKNMLGRDTRSTPSHQTNWFCDGSHSRQFDYLFQLWRSFLLWKWVFFRKPLGAKQALRFPLCCRASSPPDECQGSWCLLFCQQTCCNRSW